METISHNSIQHQLPPHLVPKYRRKVLVGEVAERLKELLLQKAQEIGVEIVQMEVMPDHVHLFVKTDPTNSPHFIVNQLKSFTSRVLREEFPFLKSRLPPYGRARTTVSRSDTYRKRP